MTNYPDAVDPAKVGTYSLLTKSGGGLFYDEVLEYRVWVHPHDGRDDYYQAFATYAEAWKFSKATPRSEEPLVLVLQKEHVNEPEQGVYEHVIGDRITEWRVEWLDRKRTETSIADFLREHSQQ